MRFAVIVSALLLGACGGGDAKSGLLDDSQEQLVAMSEGDRAPVLLRAIRAGNRRCGQVVGSRAINPPGAIPTYVAQCDNGDRFVVFIRRGGKTDIQITSEAATAS